MKTKKIIQMVFTVLAVVGLVFVISSNKIAKAQDSYFADMQLGSTNDLSDIELPQEEDLSGPPGEVRYIGKEKTEPVTIRVVKYNENSFEETEVDTPAAARELVEDGFVTWIDVSGVHDEKIIKEFGTAFDLSPIEQADIANTTKRPDIRENDNYIFVSLKMIDESSSVDAMQLEQINLVWGNNYVISFQANSDKDFDLVYDQLAKKRGLMSKMGSDYLAFVLIDTVVDSYFPALEIVNEQIDVLEKQLMDSPNEDILKGIYIVKRELTVGRQVIWPIRDVVYNLSTYDYPLVSSEVKNYFHATYENIEYLNSTIEIFWTIASDMVNFYLSIFSHDTNHILKFLTIFSTVLFLLSFVAAIYGMNLSQFHSKDKKKKGTLIVFLMMTLLVAIALIYFLLAG